MSDQPLYLIPLRVVLLAFVGVLVAGALAGAGTAWVLVRRLGWQEPARIEGREQRVEQAPRIKNSPAAVAEEVQSGVVGILDTKGALVQTGVALTADGLLVTIANPGLPRVPQILLPDGKRVPAARVREYPEKGLLILRAAGTFPAPPLVADVSSIRGGNALVLRAIPAARAPGIRPVTVEALLAATSTSQRFPQGVGDVGVLDHELSDAYLGAPAYDLSGSLLGLTVVNNTGSALLLAPDIDSALQDTLRHPEGEVVAVFGGLRGRWLQGDETTLGAAPDTQGLLVEAVSRETPTAVSGLRARDVIVGVDEKSFQGVSALWAIFLEGARNKKPVTLDVRRGEQELQIIVTPVV